VSELTGNGWPSRRERAVPGGVFGEVLAGQGHEVAIVEAESVGGECSCYACMPSKALLRPAEALAEARRVPGAAQAVTGELDVDAALARRDQVTGGRDLGLGRGQEPGSQAMTALVVSHPEQVDVAAPPHIHP
jgi:hypothetical protein